MSKRPTYVGKSAADHATKARRFKPSLKSPSPVDLDRINKKIDLERKKEIAKRPPSELSKLYDEWRRM